jgi:hypothetical protein
MKKNTLSALFLASAFAVCGSAAAGIIDFDANANGTYFVGTVYAGGYVAEGSAIGTNYAVDGDGASNGTIHLDSWINGGVNSIWTLTKQGGGSFSLQSFDFGNGYMTWGDGDASSVTVQGITSGGAIVSQSFSIAQKEFQTLTLSPAFIDLVSVSFDAYGVDNRSAYDNIVVDAPAAQVPEPESLALLGLGLLGVAAARRKFGKTA